MKSMVTQNRASSPECPLRVTEYEPGGVMVGKSCEYFTCSREWEWEWERGWGTRGLGG